MEGPKTLIAGAGSYPEAVGQTLKTLITVFYIHHQGSGLAAVHGISKSLNTEQQQQQQQQHPSTKEVGCRSAVIEDLVYAKLGFDIINSQLF